MGKLDMRMLKWDYNSVSKAQHLLSRARYIGSKTMASVGGEVVSTYSHLQVIP